MEAKGVNFYPWVTALALVLKSNTNEWDDSAKFETHPVLAHSPQPTSNTSDAPC